MSRCWEDAIAWSKDESEKHQTHPTQASTIAHKSIKMNIVQLILKKYLLYKFVVLTVSPVIKTQLEALARSAVVTICISWAIVDMTAALRSCTLLKHIHVPAYM